MIQKKSDLERQFKYIKPSDYRLFLINLKRYWRFVNNDFVLRTAIRNLLLETPESKSKQESVLQNGFESIEIKNESEYIAICIELMKVLNEENEQSRKILRISKQFSEVSGKQNYTQTIIDSVINPINQFLIEKVNSKSKVLSVLIRFKEKIEVFNSSSFLQLYESNTKEGEDLLSLKLYEFLYDNKLEYFIEPKSKVGRTDLIIRKSPTDKVILDAKIFDNKSRNKAYILKGVNQILTYMKMENQSVGVMVIFEVCKKNILFNLENNQRLAFINVDNRRIYFIAIDLFQYEKSASKRGKINMIEISEDEIKNCA